MECRLFFAASAFALASMALAASPACAQKIVDAGTWSGFGVLGSDYTYVAAAWRQPRVTCPADNARVSFWVGLDDSTIEQAGTIAECSPGKPVVYRAWWEMYQGKHSPGREPFEVSPGDEIAASVQFAHGVFTLSVADLTNGRSFSKAETCGSAKICKRNQAEIIVERPGGGAYPLADYGEIKFHDTKGSSHAHRVVQYVMEHAGTVLSRCRAKDFRPRVNPLRFPEGLDSITCDWKAAE